MKQCTYQDKLFLNIPLFVLHDEGLNSFEKLLMGFLYNFYLSSNKTRHKVSNIYLGAFLDVTPRYIQRTLRSLEKKRYITIYTNKMYRVINIAKIYTDKEIDDNNKRFKDTLNKAYGIEEEQVNIINEDTPATNKQINIVADNPESLFKGLGEEEISEHTNYPKEDDRQTTPLKTTLNEANGYNIDGDNKNRLNNQVNTSLLNTPLLNAPLQNNSDNLQSPKPAHKYARELLNSMRQIAGKKQPNLNNKIINYSSDEQSNNQIPTPIIPNDKLVASVRNPQVLSDNSFDPRALKDDDDFHTRGLINIPALNNKPSNNIPPAFGSTPINPPQNPKKTTKEQRASNEIEIMTTNNPFDIAQEVLEDWIEIRKSKKAKITATAWQQVNETLSKLQEEGLDPKQCFLKAVAKGWALLEFKYFAQDIEDLKPSTINNNETKSTVNNNKTKLGDFYFSDSELKKMQSDHKINNKQMKEMINMGMLPAEYSHYLKEQHTQNTPL